MEILDYIDRYEHEQVLIFADKGAGLKAIIAVHDTTLGPALTGTRVWPYRSEEDAMRDALRLSRGMSYRVVAAGLNLGGGSAVIVGDPRKDKTEALMRSFGRYLDSLGGRCIAIQDMGTSGEDMERIAAETAHVAGLTAGGSGDLSALTAYGVLRAMEACAKRTFGSGSLKGKVVALQGLGKVGTALARLLFQEGAEIVACDVSDEATTVPVRQFGARIVRPDEIFDVACDIFSPCGRGGSLDKDTIARLKARVVAGGASNQLADEACAQMLADRRILYAPDYVANAGSVIQMALELRGLGLERAKQKVARIYDTVEQVIARSEAEKISTAAAADRMVEERLRSVRRIKSIHR